MEEVAERHGVRKPFQGTVATTDGETIWAFRYSSERQSRSLFYTTDVPTLRELYPDRELFQEVSDEARLVVSEPLGDVPGVWNEVPESSWGVVGLGEDRLEPFAVARRPTRCRRRLTCAAVLRDASFARIGRRNSRKMLRTSRKIPAAKGIASSAPARRSRLKSTTV